MNFLHILQGQSFELQSFIFCLKICKPSAFFNSAGNFKTKFALLYISSVPGDTRPLIVGTVFT